jgi:uncharacterized protein (DUF1330 family)
MTYLLVRHTVQDYSKWKPVFDHDGKNREAAGSKGSQVFQDINKPNEVTVIMEFENAENAEKMVESDDLHKAMHSAGVLGKPEVSFLNGGEHQPH